MVISTNLNGSWELGSEGLGWNHASKHSQDVLVYSLFDGLPDVSLGVQLARVLYGNFLLRLLRLLVDSLGPLHCPLWHFLEVLVAVLGDGRLVLQLEPVVPFLLVQVQQHLLLQLVGFVVDVDGVVVFVESFVHGLDRGFVQMAGHCCGLPRLLPGHGSFHVDEAEGVDDDLTPDWLDGVDNHGHALGVELFEWLLGVDIDAGEPAAETGVGVVPADNVLIALGLLEHVEHVFLIDRVDGFDGD